MVRHSTSIAIVHQIFNGERMTYEVTTTVTITRKHIVEADGEETAKEQAESRALNRIANIEPWELIYLADVEHELVEITSPNDEAKKYI
jgi:hypothetical protein